MVNDKYFIVKLGVRQHRSTLEESLKTTRYISQTQFNQLLPDYTYYGFDQRCNQFLFIIKNHDLGNETWLFIEYHE